MVHVLQHTHLQDKSHLVFEMTYCTCIVPPE